MLVANRVDRSILGYFRQRAYGRRHCHKQRGNIARGRNPSGSMGDSRGSILMNDATSYSTTTGIQRVVSALMNGGRKLVAQKRKIFQQKNYFRVRITLTWVVFAVSLVSLRTLPVGWKHSKMQTPRSFLYILVVCTTTHSYTTIVSFILPGFYENTFFLRRLKDISQKRHEKAFGAVVVIVVAVILQIFIRVGGYYKGKLQTLLDKGRKHKGSRMLFKTVPFHRFQNRILVHFRLPWKRPATRTKSVFATQDKANSTALI